MKTHFARMTLAAASLLAMSACNETGSCLYTTSNGYDYCEDFLGTQYNQSVTKNTCATNQGTWSSKGCFNDNALGTCAIEIATGNAQNVLYTYYATSTTADKADTTLAVESACGVAGGTFDVN